jgi:hypothetical protein
VREWLAEATVGSRDGKVRHIAIFRAILRKRCLPQLERICELALDGTVVALLGVTWEFKAPVRPGDTVKAFIEVISTRGVKKNPDRGLLELGFTLVDQNGRAAQTGSLRDLTRRTPHQRPAGATGKLGPEITRTTVNTSSNRSRGNAASGNQSKPTAAKESPCNRNQRPAHFMSEQLIGWVGFAVGFFICYLQGARRLPWRPCQKPSLFPSPIAIP